MVMVDNIIYQFTPTKCKQIDDGDFNKIELLKKTNNNNQVKNIVIGNLVENSKDYHGRKAYKAEDNGDGWGDEKIVAEIWIRRWDFPGVKSYMYYTKYMNYEKNIWGTWKEDASADTYHYIFANASWSGGSQVGYVNIHDYNRWSNNHYPSDNIITTEHNEMVIVNWFSSLGISLPTNVQLRILTKINGVDVVEYSEIFNIQPENYYENIGFKEQGVSTLSFPLFGWFGSESWGWALTPGSPGHLCMDSLSQDWNYFTFLDIECGKNIFAPFDGKILFITTDYSGNHCGSNPLPVNEGIRLVIQSNENKVFAIAFNHLKSIRPELFVGKNVAKGDLIAKVGGSGLEVADAHVHSSLYKNIYEWFQLIDSDTHEIISNTVIEYLNLGKTYITLDPNYQIECDFTADNFSAEFQFAPDNSNIFVSVGENVITNSIELEQFVLNQFITIAGDLIIGLSNRKLVLNPIESLEELESIKAIDGDLIISNTNIINLDGLDSLIFVGGDIIIEDNIQLENFCGLYNLIENDAVGGNFIISGNFTNPSQEDILNNLGCGGGLSVKKHTPKYNSLDIYPNPTNGFLNIKSNKVDKVELYSYQGQRLITVRNTNKIHIFNMANGFYFIKVFEGNKIFTKKIIKK